MTTPSPLRLITSEESRVDVPEEVCSSLGFAEIWARPGISESAALLLAELKQESCGHSWREALEHVDAADSSSLVAAILERIREVRPTMIYTYWGRSKAGESPIAIGAISTHVGHGFPHDGFPVIARCTIRRCYRGNGLYPYLLQHRLNVCTALWGSALKAVHVGAADPAVLAALTRVEGVDFAFACVGRERLIVAGERYWVPDFLAATVQFRAALEGELRDSDPRIVLLARKVSLFLSEGASSVSYAALRAEVESCRARHGDAWWDSCPNVQSLIALCEAIGVHPE